MIFYRQQIRQLRYVGRNPAHCAHLQFRGPGRAVVAKFSSKAFFAPLAEIESGTL
jgi:hypothetical protein